MNLEDFRKLVGGFLKSLNRDSTQYKIAKRYGFVVEVEKPVIFYFETMAEKQSRQALSTDNKLVKNPFTQEENRLLHKIL